MSIFFKVICRTRFLSGSGVDETAQFVEALVHDESRRALLRSNSIALSSWK